jgi:hypothetical protein
MGLFAGLAWPWKSGPSRPLGSAAYAIALRTWTSLKGAVVVSRDRYVT